MFDGINALYYVPENPGFLADLPLWEVLVYEQTGKPVNELKTAQFRGLHLAFKPSIRGGYNFLIKGSLHKWFNAGGDNTGQFSIENVQTAVHSLSTVFGIPADQLFLHGLEIGVNIPLPFPALRVLKNAVSYKGKAFTSINKRNVHKGLVCALNDYEIKMYDKAAQGGLPYGNVLRLEVKAYKMRFLKDYNLTTLAALTDPVRAYAAKDILHFVQDGIVWTDTSANLRAMADRQQKQWLFLSNPKSWQSIPKEKAYRQRQRFTALFQQFARFDTSKELRQAFTLTWDSLFIRAEEAENGTPFHHPDQQSEALTQITISPLECSVKRLPDPEQVTGISDTSSYSTKNDNIKSAKNARGLQLPVSYCLSCGIDISHQRKGSRFCSAVFVGKKAARACRNRDSNHRRDIKRKINNAMRQSCLIEVTSIDKAGIEGIQIHAPAELQGVPVSWYSKVKGVKVLKSCRGSDPKPIIKIKQ